MKRRVRILRDGEKTPASQRTRTEAWDKIREYKFNKNHKSGELPPDTPWGFYFGIAAGVAAIVYGKKLLR